MAAVVANFNKKMNALRIEADENQSKAEELQTKVKALEQENLSKEQEITSLTHRNQLLEAEVEKLEAALKEAKGIAGESAQHGAQNEALTRRLQLLEEEAEEADKTIRETNEKYVYPLASAIASLDANYACDRLRQTDVKAGHYERKVQALEQDRDQWEAKYEEMAKKHGDLQKELHELEVSMGNI
jgi:tropomyosin, fungi type